MSWDAYESRATTEWQALLNSSEGCDERKVHHFLAKHPSFVPGVFGMTEGSRLVPYYWALFSESPLREWDHANDCYRDVPGIERSRSDVPAAYIITPLEGRLCNYHRVRS